VSAPYIQTVDGPVAPDELGFTLTHEHVFFEMWADDGQGFVGQLRDEDVLAAELARFREAGAQWLALLAGSQGQTGTLVVIDLVLGLPWRSLILALAATVSDEPRRVEVRGVSLVRDGARRVVREGAPVAEKTTCVTFR
jgi:hypothetical protein